MNKEAFFLKHTAHLPSSTSQLVLFHHLFCIHFQGDPLPHPLLGGPLPCPLLGGSSSVSTFGGCPLLGGPLLCPLLGGPLPGGSHVTYPIMLLYTAIEHPQCIMGKIHMGPPKNWTDWQTNMSENITFLHYVAGSKMVNIDHWSSPCWSSISPPPIPPESTVQEVLWLYTYTLSRTMWSLYTPIPFGARVGH